MKRLILLTFSLAVAAFAQTPRYSATTGDVALVATATKFTIQQPSSGGKNIRLESATVYCSVACDVSQSQNGTAATATAGTIRTLPPENTPSSATVFTASDVGSGTALGGVIHIPAGGTIGNTAVLDLSKLALVRGSTAINYTVAIASMTGTVNITLIWSEQ